MAMVRKRYVFPLAWLALLAGPMASAGLVDVPTVEYRADSLPEDAEPAWSRETYYVTVAEIQPPGVLHLVVQGSPQETTSDGWYLEDPIPAGQDWIFVEVRAKVGAAASQDNLLTFAYAGVDAKIYIYQSSVGLFTTIGPVFQHPMDTPDGFHTFRLELRRSTDEYWFYVDGSLVHHTIGVHVYDLADFVAIGRFGPDWQAELFCDSILLGYREDAVAAESQSWSAVKSLYD
jgi:hypothetical protein